MTTNLLTFRPVGIRPSAAADHRKPDPHRHFRLWWSPGQSERQRSESDLESGEKAAGSRFSPGCFTAEKARKLRIVTTKGNSFHDAMYHSAIASRLASDFSNTNNNQARILK